MHCETQLTIRGSVEEVLAVAAPVERWPLLFRPYRLARLHGRRGDQTVVEIGVWRGPIPLRWTVEQRLLPGEGCIRYRHLLGFAHGLRSEWRLAASDDRVQVTVRHEWQPEWPIIGALAAELACAWVMLPITRHTLLQMRQAVESGRAAALHRLEAAFVRGQGSGVRGQGSGGERPE